LPCRLRPQRAVCRGDGLARQPEQTREFLRYGNPIAESLWPTTPKNSAGPFHRWRLHRRIAHENRWWTPTTVSCYASVANGFPVSAYS
jgi:hypothetical protein